MVLCHRNGKLLISFCVWMQGQGADDGELGLVRQRKGMKVRSGGGFRLVSGTWNASCHRGEQVPL